MARVALISLYDNWALGLRTLSNALVAGGHDVSVIHFKLPSHKRIDGFLKHPLHYENMHSNESHSELVLNAYNIDVNMWTLNEIHLFGDILEDLRPDLVGLSTRSVYKHYIDEVMEQLKRARNAVTVAGGFGATFDPARYLGHVDYVCIGEGESALVRMADSIDKKQDLHGINNLVYKKDGQLVYNDLEKPDTTKDYFFDVSSERTPHYFIEDNVVRKTDSFLEHIRETDQDNSYYTMCGRGCAYNCSFCSAGEFYMLYGQRGVTIKKRRNRPIENVIAELKHIKKYGFNKVFFMDSFLLGPKDYLLELFEQYEKEVGIPFFAQLFPDQTIRHPEILEHAWKAGMSHTVVGIQSGSERISNGVFNRKTSNETLIEFANMLCRYDNLRLDYHIITHNPFEDESDFNSTLELLVALPKRNAVLVLQRLKAFSGTRIAKMMAESGLKADDMEKYNKMFCLYLIRFYATDSEFQEVMRNAESCSYQDLAGIYRDVRSNTENTLNWNKQGWEHYYNTDYDKAISVFTNAIKFDNRDFSAINGRGWAHHHKKEHAQAIEDFKNVLAHARPTEKEAMQTALRGMGWALYFINEYGDAAEKFNEALKYAGAKDRPVLQDLFRGLGWSYYSQGQTEKAAKLFKKAIEHIDPENKEVMQDALKGLNLSGPAGKNFLNRIRRIVRKTWSSHPPKT